MKSIVSWLRRRGKKQVPATEDASDGLSRLPLELHFYVLEHFEPEDLAIALNVCRSWRYIWLSDEVWPWLAARWFPGLCEQIRHNATAGKARGDAFRCALVKHQLLKQGRFSHAMRLGLRLETDHFYKLSRNVSVERGGVHAYAEVREPQPDAERFSRFRLYCDGRIAWWPEPYALPYIAVVDDLRTRSRRLYSFPHHHENQVGYQAALGDKLFIMGNGCTLHAWHLETDTHHSIEVPYPFKRCVTEQETVLVIAKDSTVYLWKFGGDFRTIDMSSVYEKAAVTWGDQGDFVPSVLGPHRVGLWLRSLSIAIDFIVHPIIEDTFFVVILRSGVLSVHEINSGQLVKSHTMPADMLSRTALETAGQLRWEKVDSRGGYNLLSIYPVSRGSAHDDDGLEELCREISCRCQTWWTVGGHTLVSVCFNVHTRLFEVTRHQPFTFHQPRTFHIWDQQLLCAGRPYSPNGWHVTAYKKYSGWNEGKALVSLNFYSTTKTSSSKSHIYTRCIMPSGELELFGLDKEAKVFHDVEYVLDANQVHTRHRTPLQQQNPDTLRLVGDDDFLIFFENGMYMVWCFGDAIVK